MSIARDGAVHRFERELRLVGTLDETQRVPFPGDRRFRPSRPERAPSPVV